MTDEQNAEQPQGGAPAVDHVRGVTAADTGRDLTDIVNQAADQYGVSAVELLGGLIAESDLHEHAARERDWPDVSYGLGQQTVKYSGADVPSLSRAGDGSALDTPANRQIAREYFFDAARAVPYAARQFARWRGQESSGLDAWCRYNWPGRTPAANPNRANYARGLTQAEQYRAPDVPPTPTPVVAPIGRLQLGINVGRGWQRAQPEAPYCTPAALRRLGARWARVTALHEEAAESGYGELVEYMSVCSSVGIDILLMVGSESMRREDGSQMSWDEAAMWYKRYNDHSTAWQIGNEPDDLGSSSWGMDAEQFSELLATFRAALPDAYLVAGGLSSGNPRWLDEVDLTPVDALALHPYGKSAGGWPDPGWRFGPVEITLQDYASFGKPIWVTELGADTSLGYGELEAFQADYLLHMLTALDRASVPVACWFCCTDQQVSPFGLRRTDGEPKPVYRAFQRAAFALR